MKQRIFSLIRSPNPGTPSHQVWKKNLDWQIGASSPLLNRRGEWSDPTLVIVVSEQSGNAASQIGETRTRSSTH
jgi:hypothetical protein